MLSVAVWCIALLLHGASSYEEIEPTLLSLPPWTAAPIPFSSVAAASTVTHHVRSHLIPELYTPTVEVKPILPTAPLAPLVVPPRCLDYAPYVVTALAESPPVPLECVSAAQFLSPPVKKLEEMKHLIASNAADIAAANNLANIAAAEAATKLAAINAANVAASTQLSTTIGPVPSTSHAVQLSLSTGPNLPIETEFLPYNAGVKPVLDHQISISIPDNFEPPHAPLMSLFSQKLFGDLIAAKLALEKSANLAAKKIAAANEVNLAATDIAAANAANIAAANTAAHIAAANIKASRGADHIGAIRTAANIAAADSLTRFDNANLKFHHAFAVPQNDYILSDLNTKFVAQAPVVTKVPIARPIFKSKVDVVNPPTDEKVKDANDDSEKVTANSSAETSEDCDDSTSDSAQTPEVSAQEGKAENSDNSIQASSFVSDLAAKKYAELNSANLVVAPPVIHSPVTQHFYSLPKVVVHHTVTPPRVYAVPPYFPNLIPYVPPVRPAPRRYPSPFLATPWSSLWR